MSMRSSKRVPEAAFTGPPADLAGILSRALADATRRAW